MDSRPPFEGPTAFSVAEMHRQARRPRLSQAARYPAVQQLVEQMMAVEPDDRPESPTAVIQAIEQLLPLCREADPAMAATVLQVAEPQPLAAPATSAVPAATAPSAMPAGASRRRWWLGGLLLTVLAACGLGAWLWARGELPTGAAPGGTARASALGSSTGSARALAAGSARVPSANALPANAHGDIVPLADGRVRLTYDFQSETQLQDFEPVSPAAAYGLMQLVLATAKTMARPLSLPSSAAALKQPAVNIALGSRYLGVLMRRFPRNPLLAIPGYNAGPGAPEGWAAKRPADDFDLFVERIPYRETRLYTKRVIASMLAYAALYAEGMRSPLCEPPFEVEPADALPAPGAAAPAIGPAPTASAEPGVDPGEP